MVEGRMMQVSRDIRSSCVHEQTRVPRRSARALVGREHRGTRHVEGFRSIR